MYQKRLISGLVTIFAIGVIFGIFVADNDGFFYPLLFITLAVISVVYLVVAPKRNDATISKRMTAAALAVAAFSFGVVYLSLYTAVAQPDDDYGNSEYVSVVKITEVSSASLEARVIESDCKTANGQRIKVYANNQSEYDLVAGDYVTLSARFQKNDSIGYISNGITVVAYGTINEKSDGNGLFYSIRKSISDNSKILFRDFDDAYSISKAVTTGDRSSMDGYLFSIYKSAGISHILAISGLHISLIAMSLHNLLLGLSVNRKICCIIAAFVSIFYAGLVGFTPGAVRAATMLVFCLVSRMFLRQSDGITSLFCALFLLLILNPYSIASAGLQLSFLCTLGIMVSEPLMYQIQCFFSCKRMDGGYIARIFYSICPSVLTSLLISFVASIFTFPILFLSFDTVSYISPIVNLIAAPLFTIAVKFALVSFWVAPLSISVATIIAYPAGVLFDLVTDMSRLVFDMDIGSLSVHVSYMIVPLVFSFAIIFSLIFCDFHRTSAFLISSCMFCLSLLLCGLYNKHELASKSIAEYNCGGGEYVYYQTPNGSVYVDLGGYTAEPYVIYDNGRTALQEYVFVGYDSYSYSRFNYLSGDLRVKSISLPEPKNAFEVKLYKDIYKLANERNCKVNVYTDCYEYFTDNNQGIQIFGNTDDITNETIICIDLDGYKIRYLDDGYNNVVNCDVAVLMGDYNGERHNLRASDIYALETTDSSNDDSSSYYKTFKNGLKIIKYSKEREMEIYEP